MSAENNENKCCANISISFANLLLRLWIALRMIGAGLDKFRAGSCFGFKGTDADGTEIDIARGVSFSLENYSKKIAQISKLTFDKGFLPKPLCDMYGKPLGYILLVVGAWVVLGLFTEVSLLVAGLVFLSLGVGLATLPDDTEVVLIGIHVLIVAAALVTAKHNKISLDGLLFRKRKD